MMQKFLPTPKAMQSRQIVGLLVLVISIFMLERVGWAARLQEQTVTWLQPIEFFGMHTAEVLEFPFYIIEHEHKNLEEVQNLKRSYATALAKLSELESVQKENEALRAVIAASPGHTEKKRLAAPVLSYALTAVAMGSADGVSEGDLVYISDVLMGRIVRVQKTQSELVLFSAREAEPVLVQTESGVQGLLVGTGKRTELTQVPVQLTISPGERITTVGQQGIPPGQFVGIVASVAQPSTAPTQTAVIDQLQSFYTVPVVEIR